MVKIGDLVQRNDISLKEAFQRVRRELKENPQYLLAWKEKLNNLLYSNTSTMDIINSIFALEDNENKSLDDYHF